MGVCSKTHSAGRMQSVHDPHALYHIPEAKTGSMCVDCDIIMHLTCRLECCMMVASQDNQYKAGRSSARRQGQCSRLRLKQQPRWTSMQRVLCCWRLWCYLMDSCSAGPQGISPEHVAMRDSASRRTSMSAASSSGLSEWLKEHTDSRCCCRSTSISCRWP